MSRAVDYDVAERVFGEKRRKYDLAVMPVDHAMYMDGAHGEECWSPEFFSMDIGTAWLVVREMDKRGYFLLLESTSDRRGYECAFWKSPYVEFRETAASPALAICMAALKALEPE